MKKLNRRAFIGQTSIGLAGAFAFSQLTGFQRPIDISKIVDHPIGFQVFPIRELLAKDFQGTLKMMSGLGYQLVEMCSPPGYIDSGFSTLVNLKATDMRHLINDSGLSCPSCHFTMDELTGNLDNRIEFAQQLGLTQMVCSSFWLPKDATLDNYKESANKLNQIAEKIKKAGMQTGFHNHDMEFAKLDGMLIYDALMSDLDGDLVKMQFQTQVITLGYKASDYFTKYPGRFISSHLSDWTPEKKEVPIGQGVIDWKEYFNAAKKGGVKNFFVEMALDKFKDSATYIHGVLS